MTEPIVEIPPRTLYRVARRDGVTRFAEISPIDAESDGGNKFDVPGSGVLYLAEDPAVCFVETLARFRPSASALKALGEESSTLMAPGSVPRSWREKRVLAAIDVAHPLPFLNVDETQTHTHLMQVMGADLLAHGYEELDKSAVRGPHRKLTRALARWAFSAVAEEGKPLYGGIRSTSRFADSPCYAVFKGRRFAFAIRRPSGSARRAWRSRLGSWG